MSGGSYNYLYCKDPGTIGEGINDLTEMAARLHGLGYAPRAAAATERLLALLRDDGAISAAIADLADVWHAVEWRDSSDWNDDDMREVIERYEAQPPEIVNPDAVPPTLLEQLAAAWPNRRPVSAVQALYGAQTQDSAAPLPGIVAQALVEELVRGLRAEDRQLLTTTGPVWTRYPAAAGTFAELVTAPPLKRQPQELAWAPGDAASGHDVVICRITGTSVPTLTEES